MNTLQAIYSRKSIRNFNGESITDAEVKEILKSAYAAPVGHAKYDTLSLTVVSNNALLNKWEKVMADDVGEPNLHPFYGAPTVILVSSQAPFGELLNVNYSNAAIVVQNMALAATELGVGSCHIWGAVRSLVKNQKLINELGVKEGFIPCCAIALGKIDEKYELRKIPENRIITNFVK